MKRKVVISCLLLLACMLHSVCAALADDPEVSPVIIDRTEYVSPEFISEKTVFASAKPLIKEDCTQNLFASHTWTFGKRIASNGVETTSFGGEAATDFIKIPSSGKYVLDCTFNEKLGKGIYLVTYDSNKQFIAFKNLGYQTTPYWTFNIPDSQDASYIRFSLLRAGSTEAQLVPTQTKLYDISDDKIAGKVILNFGDSIAVANGANTKSYAVQIAEQNYAVLQNNAVSGATIRTTQTNNVLAQVNNTSASLNPAIILFNGLTNDAYPDVMSVLGSISEGFDAELDSNTFCGAFEATIKIMQEKWPNAKIIYITTHKNYNRDYDVQNTLTKLAVEMCEKWDVAIADVYSSEFNTFNEEHREKYINDGSHPNTLGYETYYVPVVESVIAQAVNTNTANGISFSPESNKIVLKTDKPSKKKKAVEIKKNADKIAYMARRQGNKFMPDEAATRYEILYALNNLFNIEKTDVVKVFEDVDNNNADLVSLFSGASIIEGYPDGTFGGEKGITRAEFIKILTVMLNLDESVEAIDEIIDIENHWGKEYITRFANHGYIKGYPDGCFKPDDNITRAEVVTIVNRVINSSDKDSTVGEDVSKSHWAYDEIRNAVITNR